ncbi:CHAT domain-containing protein [Winogradskyella thalassocola]|uniref:CHAT domain-containing protein n=1 Tax=Winogradskyella thalassocola TaxID=262004 RepID=A0A1G8L393_9FLAO|nr:CHAT domain-containing protein [Winogradskyella thalassocola]SDI49610.1 CHAT domain-containing protein [Winogradskyella thalassocola]
MRFKYLLLLSFVIFCLLSCGPSKAYKSWERNYNKGVSLFEADSTKEALVFMKNAYAIGNDIFRDKDSMLTSTTIYYADFNKSLRNFDDAAELYKKAISIAKANNDKEKQVGFYKKLGLTYKGRDNKASVESFNASKILLEDLNKTNTLAYADILYQMSSIHKFLAEYEKAIALVDSSNVVVKRLLDSTKQYPRNLIMLSQIYWSQRNIEKAVPTLEKAISYYVSEEDKSTQEYAAALYTMAILYGENGDYEKEIEAYKEVMQILGEKHGAYHNVLNNIGQAYTNLGDYEQALNYTEQSLIAINSENPNYATRLQNKAFILVRLGNYNNAEVVYQQALSSMENRLGENHPNYGQLLNNVGEMYYAKGDLSKAKDYFKEALDVFLRNYEETDKRYSYQLSDYAKTLFQLNEQEKAIALMKKNLKLEEDNQRINTQNYYSLQTSLGRAYNELQNYSEALPLLENAAVQSRLISGKDHPVNRTIFSELAKTYIGLNDIDKAIPTLETSNENLKNQIDEIFKFRSEKEKKQFLNTVIHNFNALQALEFKDKGDKEKLNELNLNNQLMLKGLLLNNSKDVLNELAKLNDSLINARIESYKASKRQLSKLMTITVEKKTQKIDSLSTVINVKETELVKLYSTNFSNNYSLLKDWTTVKNALNNNDVAIEFSNYKTSTSNGEKSTQYVAYIYTKNSKAPELVPLFEERELVEILESSSPNVLYAARGAKAKNVANTTDLYDLLWLPLQSHINNVERIYYSPSGLLNQIPFAALGKKDESILANQYEMIQLSSTNNLIEEQNSLDTDNVLLIGGINYDYNPSNITVNPKKIKTDSSLIENTINTEDTTIAWKALPGTLNEITTIEKLFLTNNKSPVVWTDKSATETKFKSLNGKSPSVIHIATHGFFFENPEDTNKNYDLESESVYKASEDPLIRSGLIFSGANYAWEHGNNPNEEDDGILTALEISNLDLSNTDLVVLSACETGLGDIDGSEGVYGLQRAFKMAGVDYIVMSLWEVPDKETAEFMELFYKEWITNKKEITFAFNTTQRLMHKKYKNEPVKWAAFVLFK